MATQLQHFALTSLLFIVPWLCLCLDFFPRGLLTWVPSLVTHRYEWIFGLPIAVFASLGLYAFGSVVYGVYTFNDCPTARRELIGQIEEARRDLRRRRIIE